MTENLNKTKKLALCGLLTALALIFAYVEVLIPLSFAMPGIKLGLANIVVVIALYTLGPAYGLFINAARVLLSALLFGNMFSAMYSLAGCLLSFVVMLLLKKTGLFSLCGVSMAGGVFHNLGQLCVAAFAMQTSSVWYYYPVLLLAGMATGIGIGIVASLVIEKLNVASGSDGR